MDSGAKFSDLSEEEQERIAATLRKQVKPEVTTGDVAPVTPQGFTPTARPTDFGYGDRHPHKLH